MGSLVAWELHQSNMQKRSEFSRVIAKDFFDNHADTLVFRRIDDQLPILKQHGGVADEYDLDEYLGQFEQIKNYLDAGALNLRDVIDNYSHYVQSAYYNGEVRAYIHKIRTDYKDSNYYTNFENLALQMRQVDRR